MKLKNLFQSFCVIIAFIALIYAAAEPELGTPVSVFIITKIISIIVFILAVYFSKGFEFQNKD